MQSWVPFHGSNMKLRACLYDNLSSCSVGSDKREQHLSKQGYIHAMQSYIILPICMFNTFGLILAKKPEQTGFIHLWCVWVWAYKPKILGSRKSFCSHPRSPHSPTAWQTRVIASSSHRAPSRWVLAWTLRSSRLHKCRGSIRGLVTCKYTSISQSTQCVCTHILSTPMPTSCIS